MKNIIGNLRSECIRLFSKSTFIICIVLYILAIIAILITEPFSDGLKYSCDGMLTYIVGLSNFQRVLVLLASLPMATSFCDDIADKYMDLIILHSSTHTYIVSKIIICFLSSFAVSFIGMMIYSVYCSITNGVGIQLFNIKEGTVYYDCVNSSFPFLVIMYQIYYLVSIARFDFFVYVCLHILSTAYHLKKAQSCAQPHFYRPFQPPCRFQRETRGS